MRKKPKKDLPLDLQCPCCDYFTLNEWAENQVCPVCFWENDGIDLALLFQQSDANGKKTLDQARQSFDDFGACGKEWLQKVCSASERAGFKCESRQDEVQLLRLAAKIADNEIPVIREDSECPQCEWGDGWNYLFAPGAKGYVVYGRPRKSLLKLWCASPRNQAKTLQEKLV